MPAISGIRIRPVSEAEVQPCIDLVMRVFREFVAPDFRPEGAASFARWADAAAFGRRLRDGNLALAAFLRKQIVGVIEWAPPDHIAMLFVDPAIQGEGTGRRLFEEALRRIRAAHPEVRTMHVHASRHAVPFYRQLGFREAGPEEERDGIRYTPMLREAGE